MVCQGKWNVPNTFGKSAEGDENHWKHTENLQFYTINYSIVAKADRALVLIILCKFYIIFYNSDKVILYKNYLIQV